MRIGFFPSRLRRTAWRAVALLAMAGLSATAAAQQLRVMSFNVRVPVESDGPDRWEARRELMAQTIREARPDLIGTQELVKAQGDYLVEQLPEYAWFGIGRRGDDGDEHMGVFYRKDSLRLVESGNFWLSDTPELRGSISWGNLYPRMVTWGLFEQKGSGRRFYLFDTHLPYRDEDAAARLRSAELILQRLAKIPSAIPVLLTGDFNDVPDSAVYRKLTGALRDARVEAPLREGPDLTFHAFTGQASKRLDWVLYRGLRAESVRTVTAHRDGRYPSDHFPVLATFDFD